MVFLRACHNMLRSGPGWRTALVLVPAALLLAACAQTELVVHTAKQAQEASVVDAPPPERGYKVGKPYQVNGSWYYPAEDYNYEETGIASWYGPNFHGKRTANGERYDQYALTAAHRTLPMPSAVRVTNMQNGRSIVVRINDRGPFARGRIIDMSRRGAQLLGFEGQGTARVRVEILAPESKQLKLAAINGVPGTAEAQLAVSASPREGVIAEPLPPVEGQPADRTVEIASATDDAPIVATSLGRTQLDPVVLPTGVEVLTISPTGIYVQAGAFGDFGNALRMRDRLYGMAPIQISRVTIAGSDLYRVRLGPLGSVGEADGLLGRVIDSGIPEARLIVE